MFLGVVFSRCVFVGVVFVGIVVFLRIVFRLVRRRILVVSELGIAVVIKPLVDRGAGDGFSRASQHQCGFVLIGLDHLRGLLFCIIVRYGLAVFVGFDVLALALDFVLFGLIFGSLGSTHATA